MNLKIVITAVVFLVLFSSISLAYEQSHPLSQIYPIDTSLNMSGYNITNVSYIGIGTSTPSYPLDIVGNVRWSGTLVSGSVPWARLTNFPSSCSCPDGYAVRIIGTDCQCIQINSTQGVVSGSGTTNYIPVWTSSSSLGNSVIYQGSNVLSIQSNYNLNIVSGSLQIGGTDVIDSSRNLLNIGSITASGPVNIDSGTLYVDSSNNRVGIGTTSPSTFTTIQNSFSKGSYSTWFTLRASGTNKYLGMGYDNGNDYAFIRSWELGVGNKKLLLEGSPVQIAGNLLPSSNNVYDLGSSSVRWKNGYFAGDLYVSGTIHGNVEGDISSTGNLNMNGHDIYNANNVNATRFFQSGKQVIDTITAGGGISVQQNGNSVTISHADTSSQSNVTNSGLAFIQGVTLDTYGHVTGLTSATINAGNGLTSSGTTINVGAGTGIVVSSDSVSVDNSVVPFKSNNEHISGSWMFDNDLTVMKNLYVGGNLTYVNSQTLNVNGSVIPPLDNWFDLGNSTNRWRNVYGVNGYFTNIQASNINGGSAINGGGSANYVAKWSDSDTLTTSTIYDNGNVGIGTTNPSSFKLQVAGNVGPDSDNAYNLGSSSNAWKDIYLKGVLTFAQNSVTTEDVTFDGSTGTGLKVSNSNGYVTITPLNSGWAHIYTDRPKFIFNKPVYTTADTFSSYDADLSLQRIGTTKLKLGDSDSTFYTNVLPSADNTYNLGSSSVRWKNGYFAGTVYASSFEGDISANNVEDIWVNETGDTMTGKLTITSGGLEVTGGNVNLNNLNVDSGTLYVDSSNNRVGIGTTSPDNKLDVNGNIEITNGDLVLNASGTRQTVINWYGGDKNGLGVAIQSGGALIVGSGESASAASSNLSPSTEQLWLTSDATGTSVAMKFITGIQSGWDNRVDAMTILGNGNVGIGTTSPSYKLDVSGSGRFTGDLYVSGTIHGNVEGQITQTGDLNMNGYDIYNATNINTTNLFASNSIYQNGNQVIDTITANSPITVSGSGNSRTIGMQTSGVTSGTYGSASKVPQITVDQYGRITSASNVNIAIDASQITSGILPLSRGGTGADLSSASDLPIKKSGSSFVASAINLGTSDVTGTLPISHGGTGATSASSARSNLGASGVGTCPNGYVVQNLTTGAPECVEVDTSNTNELQNIWYTISVPSGSNPVPDSTSDTLTLSTQSGSGLTITGDSSTDTVTFGVDFNTIQKRVSGSCNDGYGIRIINSDGTVTCQRFVKQAGDTMGGNLDMNGYLIQNIGSSGTDFTSGGGLTLAGDLTVNGGDIDMVKGQTSTIHSLGQISFDWTTGGSYDNPQYHGIQSKDENGNWADDLRINSYSNIINTIDSNSNDGNSKFIIQHESTANGEDLFTIDETGKTYIKGNVGIGTTNPQNKLNVIGDINATGDIFSKGYNLTAVAASGVTGSGTTNYIPVWTSSSSLGNSVIYQTGGNIGIGITSPSAKLHIYSPDTDVAKLYVTGSSQGTGMVYVGQSTSYGGGIVYNGDDNPDLSFTTDAVSFFRRSGGTDYEVFYYMHNSNTVNFNGDINMKDHNVLDANTVQANTIYDPEDSYLSIGDNVYFTVNGTRLYLKSESGQTYAGVYTRSDSNRLYIRAENTDNVAQFASYGLYLPQDVSTGLYVRGGAIINYGGSQFVVDNSGNVNADSGTLYVDAANNRVGIGTTSPSYKLDVSGSGRFTGDLHVSGTIYGDLSGSIEGDLNMNGHDIYNANNVNATRFFQNGKQVIDTVTAGTGLTGGGSGSSVSLSVKYGSTAGTAVEGNKQITITPGSGLTGGGTITLGSGGSVTISHADTSSQSNVTNSGGTVIQGVTLDTYGHVRGLSSVNLDNRYIQGSGTSGYLAKFTGTRTAASSVVQESSGKIGIGKSPSEKLDVSGNIQINDGNPTGTYKIKGHRDFYAGDMTEVLTTSTTYQGLKYLLSLFNSNYGIKPRYVNVIARVWNEKAGNTTYINVTFVGCASVERQVTGTTKQLVTASIDVSSCPDGVYQTYVYLKTTPNGVAHNDLIEFYYVE